MRYQDDIYTEHNMKSKGRAAVAQWTKRLTRNGQTRVRIRKAHIFDITHLHVCSVLWNCCEICRLSFICHILTSKIFNYKEKTLFYDAISKLNAFKITIQLYREQFENHDYNLQIFLYLQAQIVKLILTWIFTFAY